jgi:hypothetical protein
MKRKIIYVAILLIQLSNLYAQDKNKQENLRSNSFIENTKVVFDNSAIESIFLNPNEILKNIDSFWENNKAFNLTKKWHLRNKIEIPFDSWRNSIEEISEQNLEERKSQIAYLNSQKIMDSRKTFCEKVIPHIFSFLPQNTFAIKSNIFLLTGTVPYAFANSGNIVIDVASPNFDKNPERILNILVHEVFHIGYFNTLVNRMEYEYENDKYDYLSEYLFMEGLANYVSYKAQDYFPNHEFDDYLMLEDDGEVKNHIEKINEMFSESDDLSMSEVKQSSWEIGVEERSYYVVGAYMAKMIDEKYGRDSLISTISNGPRKFITTYNSIAENDRKIIEFKLPKEISSYQKLRLALAKKDYLEFEKIKNELINSNSPLTTRFENKINEYGYAFMKIDNFDALKLFELNTILFPNSSNVYDSLGEAKIFFANKVKE